MNFILKMQTTLSRSGFLPRTIQNYNFNTKRETFEKELSSFIHLNLGNWRFFVSERILTSSPLPTSVSLL